MMKQSYIFLSLLICALSSSASAQVTWEPCNNSKVGFSTVESMIALPQGRLFVASAGAYDKYHVGVYRSDDWGKNWTQVLAGVSINSLTRDNLTGMIYATSDSALYRSSDGTSWEQAKNPDAPAKIVSVAIGPDQTLYAASYNSRVYRSTTQGTTWVEITSVLEDKYVLQLVSTPSRIFATSTKGIYESTNRGTTWAKLPNATISARYFKRTPNGTIVGMGTENRNRILDCSSDEGQTWYQSIIPGGIHIFLYALCVDSANNIYVSASNGIFSSRDNGKTWDSVRGAMDFTGHKMESDGEILYMGLRSPRNSATLRGYLIQSPNRGEYWTKEPEWGIGESRVNALHVDPDQAIVAATEHGLYRSHNKGDTWERLGQRDLENVTAYMRTKNGTLFAVDDGSGLFRSKDNGQTWVPVDTNATTIIRGIAETDDGSIFVVKHFTYIYWATTAGLYRSRDDGNSWDSIRNLTRFFDPWPRFNNITAHRNTLYMGVEGDGKPEHPYYVKDTAAIFLTTDWGATWTNSGINTIGRNASVQVNPHTGWVIGGSFLSTDGGSTWDLHEKWDRVQDMQLVARPNALYTFAYCCAPGVSFSDGATWDTIATPGVFGGRFNCGAIDSSGTLYGGSSQWYGVYRATAPTLKVSEPAADTRSRRANQVVSDHLVLPYSSKTPEVYDMLGRPYSCAVNHSGGDMHIDVRALPEGLYFAIGSDVTPFLKRAR